MLKPSKNGTLSGGIRTALCALALAGACAGGAIGGALTAGPLQAEAADKEDKPIILRVCNWEEYIDLGDWDEEETIELESGDISLEDSFKAYEKAVALRDSLNALLDEGDKRIRVLTEAGEAELAPKEEP